MHATTTDDHPTACARCGADFPVHPPGYVGGTGYATTAAGSAICYRCCADDDRQYMIDNGRHGGLYLTEPTNGGRATVGSWSGSLTFSAHVVSRFNGRGFGGAYPVVVAHFTGPDGKPWSIRVAGNMQLGRARRLSS